MRSEGTSKIEDRGLRIEGEPGTPAIFDPPSSLVAARGFTLLELVMVMSIIVILAAVGVTAYQHIQLKARETILKQDLQTMRKMIDQYAADKEKLPSSLDDLATAGYI